MSSQGSKSPDLSLIHWRYRGGRALMLAVFMPALLRGRAPLLKVEGKRAAPSGTQCDPPGALVPRLPALQYPSDGLPDLGSKRIYHNRTERHSPAADVDLHHIVKERLQSTSAFNKNHTQNSLTL